MLTGSIRSSYVMLSAMLDLVNGCYHLLVAQAIVRIHNVHRLCSACTLIARKLFRVLRSA